MTKEAILKALKTAGTVLIIGAAALILMPGLLTYVMGLGRILLIVLITLVVATIAGNIIFRLKKTAVQSNMHKGPGESGNSVQPDESPVEPTNSSLSKANSDIVGQD